MDDPYDAATPGTDPRHDRPQARETYTVDADLDTLADAFSDTFGSLEERGYPVAGVYGPTPVMGTPIEIRCYVVEDDATMRVAHDAVTDDGTYTSRVTLHADRSDRVDALQGRVDAVMEEFQPREDPGLFDRVRAALGR